MPIDVQTITTKQRDLILKIEEGHFSELKRIDIQPSKLTQTISAFANSDGGEIYIGFDEVGPQKEIKWRGFANVEAANNHLNVFEQLFPLGKDFYYTFLRCDSVGNETT